MSDRKSKASRFLRAVAAIAGGVILTSPAGAHEGHAHAVPEGPQHVAHADHQHPAQADATTGEYVRSARSYAVPDVVLVDRDARPVRLREVLAANEPVMLNFIFTTCTAICPVMTSIFAMVPGQLGAEAGRLRMISISIDPENDTPQQLGTYAKKYGAGPRWQFLTGSVESIRTVGRAFDSYRGDKMNHEPLTLLRPAPGEPWVRIDGFASPEQLAREYRKVVLH